MDLGVFTMLAMTFRPPTMNVPGHHCCISGPWAWPV